MWDLAVVGAGPAGSSAALAARRHQPDARVVLLDASEFPRDKPCGDGIAPHAADVVAQLGVHDATAGFPAVHRLRLGFVAGPQVENTMRRAAFVVPRTVFDARLVAAAVGAGVTFRRHRVRRVEHRPDRVVLDGVIAARVVVAADGANSAVRRLAGLQAADRQVAIAIRGYAPVRPGLADAQVITFADKGWPAYAWSFPIGDGRANVGYGELREVGRALTRSHLLDRLEALLPGVGADGTGWRAHHLPLSPGRPRQPDGRMLFAGDALSLINPLTGEGIYYAVLSGALAGRSAVTNAAADPGAGYRAELRRELGRHLRHTRVAASLAGRRRVVEAALRAAHASSVFDDFVELGLGRGLLTTRLVGAVLTPARSPR